MTPWNCAEHIFVIFPLWAYFPLALAIQLLKRSLVNSSCGTTSFINKNTFNSKVIHYSFIAVLHSNSKHTAFIHFRYKNYWRQNGRCVLLIKMNKEPQRIPAYNEREVLKKIFRRLGFFNRRR